MNFTDSKRKERSIKTLVTSRGNPYQTIIWLSILGSGLVFFFLLFVFFARMKMPDWQSVALPPAFFYSTIVILLSSFSLNFAKRSFREEHYSQYFNWLLITNILALSFAILQIAGWKHLLQAGVQISMISGAFIYIISGLHFLHLLLGLGGMGWALFDAYHNRQYVDGFIVSLNPIKTSYLAMLTIFWHFLGLLWLILFCILWLQA